MSTTRSDGAHRGGATVKITEIKLRFVEAGKDGLLAWASCVLNSTVVLNNIAVRRGHGGSLYLSYPAKQTTAGTRFYYFNPISADAAAVLESAIVGKVRELLGPSAAPPAKGMERI